jgi:hypothetical protein
LPGFQATDVLLQLDAIKMLHQGEALWTALHFMPPASSGPASAPADNSRTALAQQQLRAADMELLLTEQKARNAIKGFWNDTIRAIEQVM